MRFPKRGQRGFTLIELLIVVAILGVLAAIIIPNVGRFIGAGEEEAAKTELGNVQSAVMAMMIDNGLSKLLDPVDGTTHVATNDMSAFPDLSTIASGNKASDADGVAYVDASDKDGFILYQHDIKAGDGAINLVNYVTNQLTSQKYTVDASGTVSVAP